MSGQLGGVCVCNSEAVTVVIDDLPPSPSVAPAFTLWILANMMGENWYFSVLLTHVLLTMSEHLSHVQQPFVIHFCESHLPSPSPPPIRLLVIFLLICTCSLYFREISLCDVSYRYSPQAVIQSSTSNLSARDHTLCSFFKNSTIIEL